MKTSPDEFDRRGGGSPPRADHTPSALPAVQSSIEKDLQTGVSTNSGLNRAAKKNTDSQWYVIRCTYGREKNAYELFLKHGIEAFYPTITIHKTSEGNTTTLEESRIPNILFAFATFEQLKEYVYDNYHDDTRYLRFYYNKHHDGTKEPMVVPPKQMQSLIRICEAEADDKHLEPYVVDKFRTGQMVRITDGPFKGVEGIVDRYKGQLRIGIVVESLFTVTTAYVSKDKLEPIDTSSENSK